MHSGLYHSVVSNCQVHHNCCLLQYSPDLWSLDFLHIQDRALFDLHQTPNLDLNDRKFHCDPPLEYDFWTMYCGNVVKCSICNSVRRNSEGKSSIFFSTIPCWPSALKRQGHIWLSGWMVLKVANGPGFKPSAKGGVSSKCLSLFFAFVCTLGAASAWGSSCVAFIFLHSHNMRQ